MKRTTNFQAKSKRERMSYILKNVQESAQIANPQFRKSMAAARCTVAIATKTFAGVV